MSNPLYRACIRAGSLLCIVLLTCLQFSATAQVITTFGGTGVYGEIGDGGPATVARLDSVTNLATDRDGNIYLSCQAKHCVRKISKDGIITRVAGTSGSAGFSGDFGAATAAKLSANWGVATDTFGNLYITDPGNQRIRKVDAAGVITTIAGMGTAGYFGDGGPASLAHFNVPLGIAVDNEGNIFVADAANRVVRKISNTGLISTYAGNHTYGFSGDGGPATYAQLSNIFGLALDNTGNLYICDATNERVRKVSPAGIITTVAGNGSTGSGGDGGPATAAELNRPIGVSVNANGDILIADSRNNRIRKVNSAGIISTVAGTGGAGYSGDGIAATSALLNHPLSVISDTEQNVYIADMRNFRVRKILAAVSFIKGRSQVFAMCENGVAAIDTFLAIQDYYAGLTDTWSLLSPPAHGVASVSYSTTSTGGIITPSGLTYTPAAGFSGFDTFSVKVTDGAASDSLTLYVNVIPLVTTAGSIVGPDEVCAGSSITLTGTISGGTWSAGDANTTVVPIGDNGKVTGVTAGLSIISYTVSNSCNAVSVTKAVTVRPLPEPGAIAGANAVCKGSTITLSASVPGGIWNSSMANSIVSAGVVTGLTAGIDVIRYTVFNAWCEATATHPIVIDSFPEAGVITGNDAVCLGATVTLTDSAKNGTWSSNSPAVSVFAINPVSAGRGVATGLAAGIAPVSYSVTNSCGTAVAIKQVTINTLPDEPVISEQLGYLAAGANYSSYQWLANGIAIAGAVDDSFYAMEAGLYAVTVTNSFGCQVTSTPYTFEGCDAADMLVYPNPSASQVKIQWCRKVTVRVMAADGRLVAVVKGVNEVELSGLANGVYFIDIFDGSGIRVKTVKVIKATIN
ncbi:MAG: T9SS type A sorting domain-containing protein [Bacteroidota bacterium]